MMVNLVFNEVISLNTLNIQKQLSDQCHSHIETSLLIRRANQLTGFYMTGPLVVKWLNNNSI